MNVGDSGAREIVGQPIPIELGIVARARDGANVGEPPDALGGEQLDQLVDASCSVADRPHAHRQVICPRSQSTPEPEDRQFACVAAGGSFNLAIVILRRLVGLFLAAAILALAPAAQASPPDQSWISGLYDNADFDDVVLLITSNLGAVELGIVWSLRPVARVIGLVMPMEREHQAVCPLSSVLGRAPPLA